MSRTLKPWTEVDEAFLVDCVRKYDTRKQAYSEAAKQLLRSTTACSVKYSELMRNQKEKSSTEEKSTDVNLLTTILGNIPKLPIRKITILRNTITLEI